MKKYTKQIDGKTVIKARKEIVIRKDGRVTYNPTKDMILADGWVEYIEPKPTEEEMQKAALLKTRQKKLKEANSYDKSTEVNSFFVAELQMWLDKATRAGLLLRFQAEQAQGLEDTTLWYNGMQFPLKVDQAIEMLFAIELYASACYDNTQRHLAAISNLATIEEIKSYDYTQGYPDKLRF